MEDQATGQWRGPTGGTLPLMPLQGFLSLGKQDSGQPHHPPLLSAQVSLFPFPFG